MIADGCPVRIYTQSRDVVGHRCGRPVVRLGKCGIHAAAEERRAKNRERWQQEWDAEKQEAVRVDGLIAELAEYDVQAAPIWKSSRVSVKPEDLLALLRDLIGTDRTLR